MASILALAGAASPSASAFLISFNNIGGLTSPAETALNAAAQVWTSKFTDPVTVRIDVAFSLLTGDSADAIAVSPSVKVDIPYSNVRDALLLDQRSPDDRSATSSLQAGPAIGFFTTDRNGNRVQDVDIGTDNLVLRTTRADAKALGIVPNDTASDGTINFNTKYLPEFDFDRSNGIDRNQYDFIGIAAHEIGHALGFISGVDTIDYYAAPNGGGKNAAFDREVTPTFSVLDLFRYTTDSAAAGHLLDLAVGGEPYFSLNSGMTSLGRFSNGAYNGTDFGPDSSGNPIRYQASHWFSTNPSIGLMDPTIEPKGVLANISELDLRAFDVIGWNRAPLPPTLWLVVLGIVLVRGFEARTRRPEVVAQVSSDARANPRQRKC